MTGGKSGVAARMKEEHGYLLNIHCMAHRLALCTSQAANEVAYVKKYREIISNIYFHFKHSAVRTADLKLIEAILDDKQLNLKEVHAVHWFAFYHALEAIYHSWSAFGYLFSAGEIGKGSSCKV